MSEKLQQQTFKQQTFSRSEIRRMILKGNKNIDMDRIGEIVEEAWRRQFVSDYVAREFANNLLWMTIIGNR